MKQFMIIFFARYGCMSDNRIVVPKDIWAMFTELCCVNEIAIVSMMSNNGANVDVGYHRNIDKAYVILLRSPVFV